MEYDPHQLIEGILIAGLAVDAHEGYIYIRGEYRYLIDDMDRAIAEAYAQGLSGQEHRGHGLRFRSLHAFAARALMNAAKKPRCSIRSKASAAFRG